MAGAPPPRHRPGERPPPPATGNPVRGDDKQNLGSNAALDSPEINRMTYNQKRAWLRRMGYAVNPRGGGDRQFQMAWKAFRNGVPPSYWNKNAKVSNTYRATRPGPTRSGGGPTPPGRPGRGGGGPGGAGPGVGAGAGPGAHSGGSGPILSSPINVAQYAQTLTNQEYQPQI